MYTLYGDCSLRGFAPAATAAYVATGAAAGTIRGSGRTDGTYTSTLESTGAAAGSHPLQRPVSPGVAFNSLRTLLLRQIRPAWHLSTYPPHA